MAHQAACFVSRIGLIATSAGNPWNPADRLQPQVQGGSALVQARANGFVERLHVRAALTRKNYLFAGSDAGGERAAVAYTILGSCRLAGVNPREYLADVLPRLARGIRLRDVGKSIPVRWQTARARSEPASAPER